MKPTCLVVSLALLCAVPLARAAADPIADAVASADRPATDTSRDKLRHPAQLLAFAGVKPGDQVAEIMPGKGYFTRIFSNLVGTAGHVYALVPKEILAVLPKAPDAVTALAADKAFPNVSVLVQPVGEFAPPAKVDVAWTSDNYHDVYGFFGADHAAAMDVAVFKALKPGGVFIVIDHAAKAGSGGTDATSLHRIDPDVVEQQVLAAGFTLEAKSEILANPADPQTAKVFDPAIRGRTDQFAFKFRKPG
jgi:predicted methyltransferase